MILCCCNVICEGVFILNDNALKNIKVKHKSSNNTVINKKIKFVSEVAIPFI
ncbi:hypothetical protein G163CM_28410 [Pseudocitrobacter corydidari]|uniref:Uncharacterized protein n=1 Tax=Pseudocitrobacter corydidari TaxID=2891570 RepID=A0ABY3S7I4_9ENTR|nr:hypothetical protein G163CM_28410 [Pseudocitrobacter corydidari]